MPAVVQRLDARVFIAEYDPSAPCPRAWRVSKGKPWSVVSEIDNFVCFFIIITLDHMKAMPHVDRSSSLMVTVCPASNSVSKPVVTRNTLACSRDKCALGFRREDDGFNV